MSLINQMLQDLEQRNASARMTEPMSGEVRAIPGSASARLSILAGLVLLASVAGAGAWLFQGKALKPDEAPASVKAIPQHAALALAVPARVAVAPEQAAPVPVPAAASPPLQDIPVVAVPVMVASAQTTTPVSSVDAVKHLRGLDANPSVVAVAQANRASAGKEAKGAPLTGSLAKPDAALSAVEPMPRGNKSALKSIPINTDASLKTVNPVQLSENFYRQSISMLQLGRSVEAHDALRRSLETNAGNLKARQTLIALLVEGKHNDEAMALMQEGLKLAPEQTNFSMSLARLQVEAGNVTAGTETLERGLHFAGDDAEYHAFYAALLQRAEHHDEAVTNYLIALKNNPAMPTWLVGIAISWQAQGKLADAGEAYRRAKDTGLLTPQMAQFVEQRMRQIRH